jgi:hypothetical protein
VASYAVKRAGIAFGISVATFVAVLVLPAGGSAATACWHQVIADWTDGHIDDVYPQLCYRQAVEHLPEDLRTYSSAADDIKRALLEAHADQSRVGPRSRRLAAATPSARSTTAPHAIGTTVIGSLGAIVLILIGTSGFVVLRRRRRA